MSAVMVAPAIHEWVDRLSPAQQDHLLVVVSRDGELPPIEAEATAPFDAAVEHWLQTTVKATCERIDAGEAKLYTPTEVDEWLAAKRAALV